jgi:Winged helix-turn helix
MRFQRGFKAYESARLVLGGSILCQGQAHFTSVLTKDEQNELEARARKYTSPYRDVIRAKIVLLAAQGLANDVIAARLDTPRQIVSKWRKRFALARLAGLEEQPRGGRPALFSPQRRRTGKSPRL